MLPEQEVKCGAYVKTCLTFPIASEEQTQNSFPSVPFLQCNVILNNNNKPKKTKANNPKRS